MNINRYMSKKAAMFDFGDTIASTVPEYPERIRLALEMSGYDLSREDYLKAYIKADYETFRRYKMSNHVDNQKRLDCLFEMLSEAAGVSGGSSDLRNEVMQNIRKVEFSKRILLNNAGNILESLKKKGLKLAIVSNNDGRVKEKCEELGVAGFFDLIVDSGNIGFIKPGAEIFDYTLSNLGLSRYEVIHVGDLYGADILGAMNAGIDPVWFNNKSSPDFENTGVVQISDLSELEDIIL